MINDIVMNGFEQTANMLVICSLFGGGWRDIRRNVGIAVLVSLEIILFLLFDYLNVNGAWTLLAYLLMVMGIRFLFSITFVESIVAFLLGFVLVGIGELLLYLPFAVVNSQMNASDCAGVIGSGGTMVLAFVGRHQLYKLRVIVEFAKKRQQSICFVGTIIFLIMFFASLYFKKFEHISIYGFGFLISFFLVMLPVFLEHAMIRREIEERCKYEKPMKDVINRIRLQQHQFDNHLNAICGIVNRCQESEELKEQLLHYIGEVGKPDPRYSLIYINDPVLSGFMGIKITEAESRGVEVITEVAVRDISSNIPNFELVGVLGNLIDNALEEVQSQQVRREDLPQKIKIRIAEEEEGYILRIQNPCRPMRTIDVSQYFKAGVSTKPGAGRGYGLCSVANTITRYNGKLIWDMVEEEDQTWFLIELQVEKKNDKQKRALR